MEQFSVLMSVYFREKPSYLDAALRSILLSDVIPNEIVLVEDGSLPDNLLAVIESYRDRLNIKSVKIPENVGLGRALQIGLAHCSFDLIARCDSDDINCEDRFFKQLKKFKDDPALDVLSGWVEEFSINPRDLGVIRKVPEENSVLKYAKRRNPVNHPCVMFKRNSVLDCGGYENLLYFEDYALWVKILMANKRVDNIQDVLVDMRAGSSMYTRRGGWRYAVLEIKALAFFFRIGFFNFFEFIANIFLRIPVRFFPNWMRMFFYKNIFR